MRVIAGEAKGRKLVSVPGAGTRPVTDKVKGAVFDILGADIRGADFLDLFAGTGSVGIEALSRGAEWAVFVERARKAIVTVQRNLEMTGLSDRAEVIQDDSFHFVEHADPELLFDYIYIAPPQYKGLWAKTIQTLDKHPMLRPYGLIVVQIHPKEAEELSPVRLTLVRERQYGSTLVQFWARREDVERPQETEAD